MPSALGSGRLLVASPFDAVESERETVAPLAAVCERSANLQRVAEVASLDHDDLLIQRGNCRDALPGR